MSDNQPWGYRWRSSQAFIIFTATLGLFSETFLYAFIVPILSYMVEVRLQLPPTQTQWLTTALLTTHGFVSIVSAPIIGHFADKTSNRKIPLLLALAGCSVGTLLVALCPSGMYQHILSITKDKKLIMISVGTLRGSCYSSGIRVSGLDCSLCHLDR